MTGDTTPQTHVDALKVVDGTLRNQGVDGPGVMHAASRVVRALADAGLLCSSPDVQPQEEDGSLRSEPAALTSETSLSTLSEQVRILMIAAYGQGRDDEANDAEFRTEQELWGALAANEVERECLRSVGIEVSHD